MLEMLLRLGIYILGFLSGFIVGVIFKKKKPAFSTSTSSTSTPSFSLPKDDSKYKKFLKEYDAGNDLKFNGISFRKGAENTCAFGLSEGYRIIKGEFVWDSVRIHTGVDRAGGGTINNLKDVVISPFNFNRSEIVEYGDKSYGSLIILYNDEYDFCIRIAHMNPKKDIVPWSLEQFKKRKSFKQNWYIGSAGNYGDSDGNHTHTEILSLSAASETLEQILFNKYGKAVLKEYSPEEIISYYRKRAFFTKKTEREIMEHWNNLKVEKSILFINDYLFRRIVNGKHVTYYNSWALFNM